MKKFLLPIVVALSIFANAPASKAQNFQVDWGSIGNNFLLNSSLTFVPDGSTVLLGHFDSSFTFSLTDTLPLLMSHFSTYATSSIGSGGAVGTGQFTQTSFLPNSTGVAGEQMYIWVFNLTNTQWTILTSTAADWMRPANDSNTVIDTAELSVVIPPGVIGSFVAGPGTPVNLGIGPVPEPSTYFLGLLGGVGLLGAMRLRRASAAS